MLNLTGWRERGFYGLAYRSSGTSPPANLTNRLSKTLEHEVDGLKHQFTRNHVQMLHRAARFLDSHLLGGTVDAGETVMLRGEPIVIAVGTNPRRRDNIPFDGRTVVDSDGIIDLQRLPNSLAVIGAGVIGVEYATIFSALDVCVTLIEPRASFLDFVDRELLGEFIRQLRDRGIAFRLGDPIEEIVMEHGQPVVTLAGGRRVRAERCSTRRAGSVPPTRWTCTAAD